MPVFMVERRYVEALEVTAAAVEGVNLVNEDEGVSWLYSFLSADRRKSYCRYEALSADAIHRAAVRAGLPSDVVTEVTDMVRPDGSLTPV